MNQRILLDSPAKTLSFFCISLLVYLFAIHARLGPELADDGAFFLRYAQNMVHGEFWVWNSGEAPVWGASAPLWPLVIALAMKLGVAPMTAIVGSSIALAAVGLAAVSFVLATRVGLVAGIAFPLLSTLDSGTMYFSGAGLETPLTFFLLAMGVWTLLDPPRAWIVGLLAGVLMVNKLDLIPVGGILLVACWMKSRRFPFLAVQLAAAIAIAWYGFAWVYFGVPVPNSFLTKLIYQTDHPKIIDWTWFGNFVFVSGMHKWLTAFSLLPALRFRREWLPVVVFLGGTALTHVIAYTLKYPFEPYNWYCMPALFGLLVLASLGIQAAADFAAARVPRFAGIAEALVPAVALSAVFSLYWSEEVRGTAWLKKASGMYEFDRAEAGRWVDANTPKHFRVYTMWGNPAYFSQRQVLDGSFLNRKVEERDLVGKYQPEVLIMQNNPGSTLSAPVFAYHVDSGYRIVKVFDNTFSNGIDYFFAVLVREDVVGQVSNIETPINLMSCVSQIVLGDQFGVLKAISDRALFVHPGAQRPTSFEFDATAFAAKSGSDAITLNLSIAKNIPAGTVERGAANVRVTIKSGEEVLIDQVVTATQSGQLLVSAKAYPKWSVVVDKNGNPDTDWLIFSAK